MKQIERRLQRDFDRIADRAPISTESWALLQHRIAAEPDRIEEEIIMLAPAETTTRRTRRLAPIALAVAAVAAVMIAGIVALRANDDVDDPMFDDGGADLLEPAPPTLEVEPTFTPAPLPAIEVDWQFGTSMPGALRQAVAWSGGLAAIMDVDADETIDGGTVWYSRDAVNWNASSFPLPVPAYHLASRNGDLFALSGDPLELKVPQTLWYQRAGKPWIEVMTSTSFDLIAVGPDRLIAYDQDGFTIAGVFDTDTMAPVEFAGLPEIDFGPEVEFEPFVYQGRAIALDEGFLATVTWGTGLDEDDRDQLVVDSRLLYSSDGSTWVEHPEPPDGAVQIPYGVSSTAVFEGLNLLSSAGTSPGRSWVTDDGLSLTGTRIPGNAVPTGTDDGFFAIDGRIHRSLDGITWDTLQTPSTWPQTPEPTGEATDDSVVLTTDDRLVAIGIFGDIEGWVGLVDPTTEIWFVER